MDDSWREAIPADAAPFFARVPDDDRYGVDVVGRDDDGLFCLDDDEHDRSVWWVSEREQGLHRFVNSSLERFGASLAVLSAGWGEQPGLSADETGQLVARLRSDLAEIDPGVPPELTAVQLPGYVEESRDYWPTLLDRLADGQS